MKPLWLLLPSFALLAACGSPAASPAPSAKPSAPAPIASTAPASAAASAAAKPVASAAPASAAASAAAKPAASGALTKLTATYTAISPTTSAPWVAKGGGFFEKQGLDVTLNFLSPTSLTAGLVSGSVDVGYGSPGNVATADAGGADLVMIGATYQGSIFSIVARPNIKSITDLKGKKIGATQRGATTDIVIRREAQRQGLGPNDFTVVYIPEQPSLVAGLSSGALDAAVLTDPATSQAVAQGNHVIYGPDTPGNDFVSMSVVVAKRSYVAAHQDLLKHFLIANIQAIKLAKTNPDEAAKYVAPYLKMDDLKLVSTSIKSSSSVMRDDLSLTIPGLQSVLESTATTDPAVAKLKPEDLVDLSLVNEIKSQGAAA